MRGRLTRLFRLSLIVASTLTASHAPPFSNAGALVTGFCENRGQADPQVGYYLQEPGATVYFLEDRLVVDLPGHALHLRFAEAPAGATLEGRGSLGPRYHFFLGSDPGRWATDVRAFEEMVYRDFRPGADLVFRRAARGIAYEIVASGALAGSVDSSPPAGSGESSGRDRSNSPAPDAPFSSLFVCDGAESVLPAGSGGTRYETRAGALVDRPYGDLSSRLLAAGELRIEPAAAAPPEGAPSAGRDDPAALLFSTYLGTAGIDWGYGVTIDVEGCPIAVGYTQSASFPTTPGSYDPTHNAGQDVFVAKLSATGDALLWGSFLGGSSNEFGFSVALDGQGNVVVAGSTGSSAFPTTAGAYDASFNGSDDGFVAKLSASGSALLWSTFLGGSGGETLRSVSLDEDGCAYVTGETQSTNFPTTAGAYDTSHNGGMDVFVSRLAANGQALLWSSFLGGAGSESGWEVCVDGAGQAVVAGYAMASSFPTTPGSFDPTYNGGDRDAFVARFDAAGSTLQWSTFLGGSVMDWSYGLALDADDNPIAVGGTTSTNFPTTPGAFDTSFAVYDAFVTKIAHDGASLLWSTFLGGSSGEEAYDVAMDPWNHPVVTGLTQSADFPVTPDAFDASYNGSSDVFVSKLSADGDALYWSSYAGGSLQERGWRLAVMPPGDPIVVGHTESNNFPTSVGAFDPSHNGTWDAFVLKLDASNASGIEAWSEEGNEPPDGGPTALPALLVASRPNPTTAQVWISFELTRSAAVRVHVLDASARVVRTIRDAAFAAGTQRLLWDGCDDAGRPVASGTYFVRADVDGCATGRSVVIVR